MLSLGPGVKPSIFYWPLADKTGIDYPLSGNQSTFYRCGKSCKSSSLGFCVMRAPRAITNMAAKKPHVDVRLVTGVRSTQAKRNVLPNS